MERALFRASCLSLSCIRDITMQNLKLSAILVGISVLLAACSSTTKLETPTPVATAAPVMASPPPAPAKASSYVAPVLVPAYLDPASPISKERSVYFDFDNSVVKPSFDALIQRQGKYLADHPQLAIRIEGNTDERGGAEYNLALGQKRADAVAQALKLQGVNSSQMETTSWGKEKPVATGHDEAAWVQNRRADLVYPNH